MNRDPNGPEGDRFVAWWDAENTGLGPAFKMAAWNAWIARASLSEAEGREQKAIALLRAWVAGCGDEAFSTKEQVKELLQVSGDFLASCSVSEESK